MKCHQLRLLKRVHDRGQKEGSPFLYLDFLTEKLVAGIIRMRLLAAISRRLPSIPHWPNGSNSSINISVWDYCIWLLDMNHQTLPSKSCLACIRLNYLLCNTVVESFLVSNADCSPVCPCSLCSCDWAQTWAGSTSVAALRLSFQKIFCMTLPINFLLVARNKINFYHQRTNWGLDITSKR